MIKRILHLTQADRESCFPWGPRQTGKTTFLRAVFPEALRYDLLLANEYRRLVHDPALIRQECRARGLTGETQTQPILIDEVQKIPACWVRCIGSLRIVAWASFSADPAPGN